MPGHLPLQAGQGLGLGHRIGQAVVGNPGPGRGFAALGGDVIVEQNGVPGIDGRTLGITQFIFEDLEAVAEIRQGQIGPAILLASCSPQTCRQGGEIEGRHRGTARENQWWWNARGYTPAGVEAWFGIRALDYLCSRPEVDARRVGVTGISMGATRTWWAMALDDRLKAGVAVCCLTRYQNLIDRQGLRFHNRFSCSAPEDAIYYMIYVLQQFGVDPEQARVILAGQVTEIFGHGPLDSERCASVAPATISHIQEMS